MSTVTGIAPDLHRPLRAAFRRNLLKTLHALNPAWSAEPRLVTAGYGTWTIFAPDGETWAQDSTEEQARTDLDRHLFSLARSAACAQASGRADCMVGTLRPGGWQWAEMSMADARKAADLALVAGVPVKLAPIAEDYTS
jgi:hypothetical protein